jgi:hypothetical protein
VPKIAYNMHFAAPIDYDDDAPDPEINSGSVSGFIDEYPSTSQEHLAPLLYEKLEEGVMSELGVHVTALTMLNVMVVELSDDEEECTAAEATQALGTPVEIDLVAYYKTLYPDEEAHGDSDALDDGEMFNDGEELF